MSATPQTIIINITHVRLMRALFSAGRNTQEIAEELNHRLELRNERDLYSEADVYNALARIR